MFNGFINLYKNKGMTSNKALSILKRTLKCNNITEKVGHFGTLDPDAEGVLPVAIGRATRLFDYMLEKTKVYYTVFRFGVDTDTLDASGKILAVSDVSVDYDSVVDAARKLTGELNQIPPSFSAKSINGERAYKLARRGESVELPPKMITVYSFEVVEKISDSLYAFRISCSGGTYIRSLARDIGKLLGTYCIMEYLLREASGIFDLKTAISLESIENDIFSALLPMEIALTTFSRYDVAPKYKKRLYNGVRILLDDLPRGFFTVYCENELVGIATDNEGLLEVRTWLL